MNSNSITDIWNNLASAKEAGFTKRRIPVESPLYVYGTYRYPDNLYGIAFSYDSSRNIPADRFKSLKELEIQQMPDTSFERRNLLQIQLRHTDCLGVFATLCTDLTEAVTRTSTEEAAIRVVMNQLEMWRTLLTVVLRQDSLRPNSRDCMANFICWPACCAETPGPKRQSSATGSVATRP